MKLINVNLVVLFILVMSACVGAAITSDGSIFTDEFNGTVLDTAKWTEYGTTGNVHAFADVVGGNLELESRFTELDKWIGSSTLNFGSANEWATELTFSILGDMVPGGTPVSTSSRASILLAGMNSALNSGADFYVSVLEGSDSGKFTLGWGGYMSALTTPVALSASATDLSRNTNYNLVAHHRTDNEIDFYLDGALIATRSAFSGAADRLGLGDFSGATTLRTKIDYIKVGAPVPEPATMALLGLGGFLASRKRSLK